MITEEAIKKWMRQRINSDDFSDTATMARQFLDENEIHDVLAPEFQMVISVGFKLADEIAAQTK